MEVEEKRGEDEPVTAPPRPFRSYCIAACLLLPRLLFLLPLKVLLPLLEYVLLL